jgi:hypothetical protein
MGIFGNLFGGNQSERPVNQYQKILTESDFTVVDHQTISSTTQWTEIATYTVPAQQILRAGYGDAGHPENEGRVYVFIRSGETTPAELTGKWRVVLTNRARSFHEPVQEFDEELTHGDLNDKRKLLPLGVQGRTLGEDDVLVIEFKPSSAHIGAGAGADNVGWADTTESLIKIPVTVRE